jgi:hypothetical protein
MFVAARFCRDLPNVRDISAQALLSRGQKAEKAPVHAGAFSCIAALVVLKFRHAFELVLGDAAQDRMVWIPFPFV